MTTAPTLSEHIDWSVLTSRLHGRVVLADEAGILDAGKQFAAGRPFEYPRALIRCRDVDDVRTALEFLRTRQIPFAVRSGGHCFADLSSSKEVVLDLAEMNEVRPTHTENSGRIAVRIGAGACAGDVSRTLAPRGLVLPTGGCPTVAMGGLCIVGGFGFLGRSYGLVTDQVRCLQVVTAEGDVVEASQHSKPELFWALRGAGAAGFGIVTNITFETHALSDIVVCHAAWQLDRAVEVFDRWQNWAPEAIGEVNLELGLAAPDDPDSPCVIELFGVILGSTALQTQKLKSLQTAFGQLAKKIRTWRLSSQAAAGYLVGMLNRQAQPAWQPCRPYPNPGYQFTRSAFYDVPIGREAFRHCVERLQSDRRYAEFREIEIIPWGGAYALPNPGACFLHRRARLLVRHTAMLGARANSELREHAKEWCDDSQSTLSAFANGHVYQGYADPRLPEWEPAYYGDTSARLRAVKRRYDPDEVFRHSQSITPL